MARPRQFDEDDALGRALDVLSSRGYEATSVDALCEATGLSRSSLYATFGGKRDLLLRAVNRYINQRGPAIAEVLERPCPVRETFGALVEGFIDQIVAGPGRRGCFLGNGAAELPQSDRVALAHVRAGLEQTEDIFRTAFARARARRELRLDTDIDALASFLTPESRGCGSPARSPPIGLSSRISPRRCSAALRTVTGRRKELPHQQNPHQQRRKGEAPVNKLARSLVQREPLVPLIDVEDFQGAMREVAERAIARSGRVPNQARAMANAGEVGAVFRRFFEDLFAKATLPADVRFLIRYKVSTMNTCLYCSAHQIKYMAQAGVSEEKIAHIHESDTHPAFDERERVALAFAAALNEDASNIPEDLVQRFVATFTPSERVEIALVAGAMGCMNRVNDALRVPLEEAALDVVGTGVDLTRIRAAGP